MRVPCSIVPPYGMSAYSTNAYHAAYAAATGIAGNVAAVLPNRPTIRHAANSLGGRIVTTWKVCRGLVTLCLLAGVAAAADPSASGVIPPPPVNAPVMAPPVTAPMPPVNATVPPVNAAGPQAPAGLSPCNAAVCTYACYTCKPAPCITPPPCDGICVPYCCKPMPCITPPPCDGICVPYCCKPMPCLCNPLARPCDCNMPACFGAGR